MSDNDPSQEKIDADLTIIPVQIVTTKTPWNFQSIFSEYKSMFMELH